MRQLLHIIFIFPLLQLAIQAQETGTIDEIEIVSFTEGIMEIAYVLPEAEGYTYTVTLALYERGATEPLLTPTNIEGDYGEGLTGGKKRCLWNVEADNTEIAAGYMDHNGFVFSLTDLFTAGEYRLEGSYQRTKEEESNWLLYAGGAALAGVAAGVAILLGGGDDEGGGGTTTVTDDYPMPPVR